MTKEEFEKKLAKVNKQIQEKENNRKSSTNWFASK